MQIKRIAPAIALTMIVGFVAPGSSNARVAFSSPSGNIFCYDTDDDSVLCLIFEENWDDAQLSALQPDNHGECNLDQMSAIELSATGPARPRKICHGDVFWPIEHKVELPYGQSVQNAGFSCLSERSGMTCRNRAGYGFTLARAAYTIHAPSS